MNILLRIAVLVLLMKMASTGNAEGPVAMEGREYKISKRSISKEGASEKRSTSSAAWAPEKTAVIICDVWDYHHSINAVRRLEEIAPRMEAFLKETRQRGSTIIHSPSDCMPAYADHPARKRAESAPKKDLPRDIASWNCQIEAERDALYPIDQSDGGEDDDPIEHAEWAAKIKSLGRNPARPWKAESPLLTIDQEKDYISDRGDEVWAILQQNGIEHVILLGVHTNMCVLGRPFGLRQMAQNGMDVVLVRDLTDCMYNPKRWPDVDHFTGNALVIAYVEQHICPTITSDQIVQGEPIRFRGDQRAKRDLMPADVEALKTAKPEWKFVELNSSGSVLITPSKQTWLRCAVRFPAGSLESTATLKAPTQVQAAWLNGHALKTKGDLSHFEIRKDQTFGNDDANILVIEYRIAKDQPDKLAVPTIVTAKGESELSGGWQRYGGPGKAPNNIPLPAKFGLSPEVFHSVR